MLGKELDPRSSQVRLCDPDSDIYAGSASAMKIDTMDDVVGLSLPTVRTSDLLFVNWDQFMT